MNNHEFAELDSKLEDRVWYRLLKVAYGIGILGVVCISLFAFFILKPTGSVLMTKSSFTCPNGQTFFWKSYSGYYIKQDTTLNEEDNYSAFLSCKLVDLSRIDREAAKKAGYTDAEIDSYINSEKFGKDQASASRLQPKYSLRWVTDETPENWVKAGIWTIIVLLVLDFLLDSLRNALIYVITGKWISYWWMRK